LHWGYEVKFQAVSVPSEGQLHITTVLSLGEETPVSDTRLYYFQSVLDAVKKTKKLFLLEIDIQCSSALSQFTNQDISAKDS
jgi:hypothetical protein